MAHLNGEEEVYRKLGGKIDSLQTRTPWNDTFREMLKTLYTAEEAEVVCRMPYGFADLDEIAKITGYEKTKLQKVLESLSTKGLVIDLWINNRYRYMPSPLMVGIFELVMMRTGDDLNSKRWAELFNQYLHGDDAYYAGNCAHGEQVAIMRTLIHDETVLPEARVEILDYEKATSIIEGSDRFAIGLCSCRHKKLHVGEKKCNIPLNTCSSFGKVADLVIRHKFGKEVSKTEMLESLARSREMKLVFTADNVREDVNFICSCCKCCCTLMLGVTQHGFPNSIVTSSFISQVDRKTCTGCGKCAHTCPVNAIHVKQAENPKSTIKKTIAIDEGLCLGCGVCGLVCPTHSIGLVKRKQRVIHPETTYERVILQCLERGTLQNQIFINPQSLTQKAMRAFVGGFLRLPPVKRALMSDTLRSTFLASMKAGSKMIGKSWLLDV